MKDKKFFKALRKFFKKKNHKKEKENEPTFALFRQLPPELRMEIWRLHRDEEIDFGASTAYARYVRHYSLAVMLYIALRLRVAVFIIAGLRFHALRP